MRKIFTFLFALVASVGMSWATTKSITINESSHGSVVASPTSAEAGETITLTATPDDGYQLKSISGVYVPVSETLNATSETVNGNKFQAQATSRNNKGWRVYNPGTANTLTVSSLNGTTLITKIEFTSTWGGQRKNNMLSVSAGTLSFDPTIDPDTIVTINGINATSVTISGSGTNAGQTWCIKSVKVYYEGTDEEELEISDTENANVKTFTMVDSEVTISAEFEPAPSNACGDGLTWELNGDVLAISYDGTGTGAMNNWDDENPAPWFNDAQDIKYVEIAEGVTSIGAYAFADCDFFFIDLPATVTSIGENAFSNIAGQGITILSTSCTLPQDLVENGNFERIFVPAASVATYQALFPDDDYRFVEIPSVQQTDNVILWDYNLCTSIMAGSPRDELEILNYHNTQGGITVTAEVDYMHGDVEAGFMYGGIVFECSGKLIFTSAVGNITHIEISGDRYDDPEITGWTWTPGEGGDNGTLSWTGNAASVELPIAQSTTLENTEIEFTLEGGGTTAIENTAVDTKAVKRIVNDQLLIEKNGKLFNVTGAEVK